MSDPIEGAPPPSRHPDRLAAIASGFVAALALAVSTYNVYLQRQQVRAQVWPRLQWTYSDFEGFSYDVQNSGVGPAEVESVRVTVDGKAVPNWNEVLRLATGEDRPHLDSFINGKVLSPGAEITPLKIANGADADAMRAAQKRVGIEICYCSSLRDCWLLSGELTRVREVPRCIAYPDAFQQ